MAPEARILGLQCLRCRARFDEPRLFTGCPRCREQSVAVNLTVEYDLAPLAGVTRDAFGRARALPRRAWLGTSHCLSSRDTPHDVDRATATIPL